METVTCPVEVLKCAEDGLTEIEACEQMMERVERLMRWILVCRPEWFREWDYVNGLTISVRPDGVGQFPRFDRLKKYGKL